MLVTDAHLPQLPFFLFSPFYCYHYNESWLTRNQLTASQKAVFPGSKQSEKRQSPYRMGFQAYLSSFTFNPNYPPQQTVMTRGTSVLSAYSSNLCGISKLFQLQKFPYTQDVRETSGENQLTYHSKITSVV